MPELRQLRAFIAVAEELNFTRAAQRLFLGQQAVSKSIRQLERELGVSLLERTTHDVRLTAAGVELLREGRDALKITDTAFERARLVGRGSAGMIEVGVSPAVGPTERAQLITALRSGAPGLEVSVRDLKPEQALQALQDREVELILARITPATDEFQTATLVPTQAHLYVPSTHRLAALRDPVPLRRLDGERLMTWNAPGTPLTDLIVSRLAVAGSSVEIIPTRVWGMATALTDLPDLAAVALLSPNWPHDDRVVELRLADNLVLPLIMVWAAGATPASVNRIRAAMT